MEDTQDILTKLKSIQTKLTKTLVNEQLITVYCMVNGGIEVKNEEKEQVLEILKEINLFLNENVEERYKIYIVNNPNIIVRNKENHKINLFELFTDCVIKSLLLHTNKELSISGSKYVQGTETSLLCNMLFRTKDYSMNVKTLKCIAYLLKEEEIKEFLNFIVKMDHKRQDETFEFTFLDELLMFFILLKLFRNDLYLKIIGVIHNEKKYFKKVFFENLPDIELNKIVHFTRDYNFGVFASLFKRRPYLIDVCCKKMSKNELLIPRKAFLELTIEHDKYFSANIKSLRFLEESELLHLCKNSDMFLDAYFKTKAGSFYELCKILAGKGEEKIIELVKNNLEHENMNELIKYISYTIKLTGTLKDYILSTFQSKKDYFNYLLPFMTHENIDLLLEQNYAEEQTFKAFLRRYVTGDMLIELHKFSSEETVRKILLEAMESEKFTTNDFIFLIKHLETAECEYVFTTIRELSKNNKLKNECADFCSKMSGCIENEIYVDCLLELNTPRVFDSLPLIDIFDLYKKNPQVKEMLDKMMKDKKCTKKLLEVKEFTKKHRK